jgi:hypothetical protein
MTAKDKEARLAAALRENLKKRKAATRSTRAEAGAQPTSSALKPGQED